MTDDAISERDGPTLEEMERGLPVWRKSIPDIRRSGPPCPCPVCKCDHKHVDKEGAKG